MNWADVLADPCLQDLPYKIELNRDGEIVMSPASNRHAIRQGRLVRLLDKWMGAGEIITECSVQTSDGVRVPDVAWASPAFMERHGAETPFSSAPELCVEIKSPSNPDRQLAKKVALYLEAGAAEVWLVQETGAVTTHGPEGRRTRSRFSGVPDAVGV